jgi:hypothetical protein
MDETELSARGGPEGQPSGAAPGPAPGEVTTDEGDSIAAEFEEGFVRGAVDTDVTEVGEGDGPFEKASGHPDRADPPPDVIQQLVDADLPTPGDQVEGESSLEELAAEVADPNLLIGFDERGFDESDVPGEVPPEPPDLEGDHPQPGGP